MKGKTEKSFIKHELLWDVAYSQAYAYRIKHPQARIVGIDMYAGDGQGVELPQMDLFKTECSPTTPQLLVGIAEKLSFSRVILCESNGKRRSQLKKRIHASLPVEVIGDNSNIRDIDLTGYDWGLVVSDPCGHAAYKDVSPLPLSADYVLTFNQGSLNRHLGMADGPIASDSERTRRVRDRKSDYAWMEELPEWQRRLARRYGARSRLIPQSPEFRFRILVFANALGDFVGRGRKLKWEIYDARRTG